MTMLLPLVMREIEQVRKKVLKRFNHFQHAQERPERLQVLIARKQESQNLSLSKDQ
jgi:hypothetical protein